MGDLRAVAGADEDREARESPPFSTSALWICPESSFSVNPARQLSQAACMPFSEIRQA